MPLFLFLFRPVHAVRMVVCLLGCISLNLASAGQTMPDQGSSLQACAVLADNAQRLACYDSAVARAYPALAPDQSGELPPEQQQIVDAHAQTAAQLAAHAHLPLATEAAPAPAEAPLEKKLPAIDLPARQKMGELWELGLHNKRGTFGFRPHRPNYLLLTYNRAPNDAPYQPLRDWAGDDVRLSKEELAFQLSFKSKLLEQPMGVPLDLWFGYTQQSFWQAANRRASSPFRETNYQPELMAVLPLNFRVLSMDARLLNLGLVHQSNGQAANLSRSWNRLYAQVGLERGDFSVQVRAWHRLKEKRQKDDNPDILDYMGHGDLLATWQRGAHELSALGRYNFDTGHGGIQLGWAFPLASNLKGYVQAFSGYGQSLVDYNHGQQTLGVGIMLNY